MVPNLKFKIKFGNKIYFKLNPNKRLSQNLLETEANSGTKINNQFKNR